MTQAEIANIPSTPKLRKNADMTGGMKTTPYFGVGMQNVENMQFEANYLKTQSGVSSLKDTTEAKILEVFRFQKEDDTYQILYIIVDGSSFKLRAVEIDDQTIVTPSGGAGDVAFSTSGFHFVQLGKTGYLGNNNQTTPLYNWDGTTLIAVTMGAGVNPLQIDALWADGKRLGASDKSQGANFFSGVAGVITSWLTGTGGAVSGIYDSTREIPTAGIDIAGITAQFTQSSSKGHKVQETNDGSAIFVTTSVQGWNSDVGVTDNFKVTKSVNFIYAVNTEGLHQISPLTGKSKNLIANSGAIKRYWDTFDVSTARVEYSAKEEMVCITVKDTGDATSDKLVLYHETYDAFYFKTNLFLTSMTVAGDQMYGGDALGGNVWKVFDDSTNTDSSGAAIFQRVVTEWDGYDDTKFEKKLKKTSGHASVFPNDSMIVTSYTDGFFDVSAKSVIYTGVDVTDTSETSATAAEYQHALGTPDTDSSSDLIRRNRSKGKFSTACVEITNTSANEMRIYSILTEYKSKGKLAKNRNLANQLR